MKKLLSILGAIVVTSTGASSVVACTDGLYSNEIWNPTSQKANSAYDTDILKTSLVSRAKSLILDDQFGFNDGVTKDFALNKQITWFDSIINNDNKSEHNYLKGKTVKDQYRNFIDDSSISNLTEINTKGEIGNEGGIFNYVENSLIGKVEDATINKLPAAVKSALDQLVGNLLHIKSGASDVELAEAIKPLLQAVGKVDVKTALAGIPYAFKLIPSLAGNYKLIVQLAGLIAGSIMKSLQKTVDPAIDKLAKAVDLSSLGDKTLDTIPDEINNILNSLLTGTYSDPATPDSFTATLKFINLTGMYLSMIPHDTNDTFKELSDISTKKLSDSEYFKIGQGKTFNVAPLLNEVSYYLSDATKSDRVQKLLQILFLDKDKQLNSVGKNIVERYIAPLINSLMGGQANLDDIKGLFIKTLTDAVEFDNLYNNWENAKLSLKINGKDVSIADQIKANINAGGDLFHTFYDDKNTESLTPSLKNLITLPIYKLLALGKVSGYEFDNENLLKTGLLPNVAGYYTQESMIQLGKEITNMFSFDTDDNSDVSAMQNELKYHLFDFNKLKDFVDRLLFNDDSFLQTFIKDAPSNGGPDAVANKLAADLGYVTDNKGIVNPKYIYVKEVDKDGKPTEQDTLIAQMIKMLLPAVDSDINPDIHYVKQNDRDVISDNDDLKPDVINKSDNLKFMFSGLTSFVGNVMKGTDYTYWLSKVVNNNYDNDVVDPNGVAHAIFDYRDGDNSDKPWDNKRTTGFTTKKFRDGTVKSMKLVIKFNLGDVPQLINGVQIKGNSDISIQKYIYTFEISRDSSTGSFKFNSATKVVDE